MKIKYGYGPNDPIWTRHKVYSQNNQPWMAPVNHNTTITNKVKDIFATNYGYSNTGANISLDLIRNELREQSNKLTIKATDYRDAILLKPELSITLPPGRSIAEKGDTLIPIIIGFVPEPQSFDWYLDEEKICTERWVEGTVYNIPVKHKFLDSNILPETAYIVPMNLSPRPIDLTDDRFFLSWYGGFIVPKSTITRIFPK